MKEWVIQEKKRLIAVGVFLALSLGLFLGFALDWSTPPVKAAKRYMKAAIRCDAMGMYDAFDQAVVAWSLEKQKELSGMDAVDIQDLAQRQSAVMEQYIDQAESYGAKVSFTYTVTGEEELDPATLDELKSAYAAMGVDMDILDARRVDLKAFATLTGAGEKAVYEQDLTFTALQTPRGWSLEMNDITAFLVFLQNLNLFAWEHFAP